MIIDLRNTSLSNFKEVLPGNRKFDIALTSGCFDILHTGHTYLLNEIKRQISGETKLVVVIHDDESIKLKKGEDRPVNIAFDRAVLLENLKPVDYVIIWQGWESVIDLVKSLRPEYLATTDDKYNSKSRWNESWDSLASDLDSQLIIVPRDNAASSTSNIIARIKVGEVHN